MPQQELLESVAHTISTYRAGEVEQPTPEHVDRWLSQFPAESRLGLLREFDHVLKDCFLSKAFISGFLEGLSRNAELTGVRPRDFWNSVNVLRIQQNGQSQREMARLLGERVEALHGVRFAINSMSREEHIYIDDIIFSGNRAQTDLLDWIRESAPQVAKLHVIVIAYYRLGQYYLSTALNRAIRASGKRITVKYWRAAELENRRSFRGSSQVLWPTSAPDTPEVRLFTQRLTRFPLEPRNPPGSVFPFSSEEGRHLLEQEFFTAGARIISRVDNWKSVMRPLGFSPFGAGFGSTLVTHRNCPNNCPLALWWGDREATSGALQWYPLLPREGYSSARNVFSSLDDE